MTETTKAGGLRLAREDVTLSEADAFVYYARHDLVLGSGFGSAISTRGGPGIQEELEEKAPVETGDVVVSEAGELPARHILHAVGPRFQEPDVEGKLRETMRNALAAADGLGIGSLAFPPMGAGYYGVPLDVCARVMVEEIRSHLAGKTSLRDVVICVQDRREEEAFEAPLRGGM